MARIVAALQTAHTPFCYRPPEAWEAARRTRPIRADVPIDDPGTNRRKHERIQNGFAVLRRKLAEAGPDVIVIFGDDQLECFDFTNFPAFSVYVGESFEGTVAEGNAPIGPEVPAQPLRRARVSGHPALATALMAGLMKHGFDPAFCMDMPRPEKGIGHAILRPVQSLTDFRTPVVPILINCYYAPQPTADRCYRFGRAVGAIVEDFPGDLRVAVIGSGGMWHTPGMPGAWLNEEFDDALLADMAKGDIQAMAARFDGYRVPEDDTSQNASERGPGVTGMPGPGGPQGGTRETCNWIAAAGAVEGTTATIVDRVPVYASPIDAAFAYFDL